MEKFYGELVDMCIINLANRTIIVCKEMILENFLSHPRFQSNKKENLWTGLPKCLKYNMSYSGLFVTEVCSIHAFLITAFCHTS